MIKIPQSVNNEQEVLNYYQRTFKSKICTEIPFLGLLDPKMQKLYNKLQGSCCCLKPLSLLIYSIIVFAIAIVGLVFCLSRNEGYKAYKEYLEGEMALVNSGFPHEDESVKLVEHLKSSEAKEDDIYFCTYIEYILQYCPEYEYRAYCNDERYYENKCNYMDRQYYLGNNYICNLGNYLHNRCSHVQYIYYKEQRGDHIDYESLIDFDYYEPKIYTNGLCFQKLWCDLDKYDFPTYLSFIIFMFIFILLLIFDIINRKKGLSTGIIYYINLCFYMIFYVIFRIYIVLFLLLYAYSILVCFTSPRIENSDEYKEPFFYSERADLLPAEKLWKDKRVNGFIFCGINLLLFFMVMALSFYKKLLYDYLTFKVDENPNPNKDIYRKASIKIGNNKYDFEIKQNKDIYLMDNKDRQKYIFKEVRSNNQEYYIKFTNLNIQDQLGWNDFDYPKVNELFANLVYMIKVMIAVSYFIIPLTFTKFDDEISYKYYNYLIDSGICMKQLLILFRLLIL